MHEWWNFMNLYQKSWKTCCSKAIDWICGFTIPCRSCTVWGRSSSVFALKYGTEVSSTQIFGFIKLQFLAKVFVKQNLARLRSRFNIVSGYRSPSVGHMFLLLCGASGCILISDDTWVQQNRITGSREAPVVAMSCNTRYSGRWPDRFHEIMDLEKSIIPLKIS